MTVLAVLKVLAVLQSTLSSFRLSYKRQDQDATVTVLVVSAVVVVSVMTAAGPTPLNSAPLSDILIKCAFFLLSCLRPKLFVLGTQCALK